MGPHESKNRPTNGKRNSQEQGAEGRSRTADKSGHSRHGAMTNETQRAETARRPPDNFAFSEGKENRTEKQADKGNKKRKNNSQRPQPKNSARSLCVVIYKMKCNRISAA